MSQEKEIILSGPEPNFPFLKESLAEHMMERMRNQPQDKIAHVSC